ncbi:Prepilin-type N-terminal cleavage/methylation domain-containing protein [Rubrivivax sp. A210]|uniref:GspH/FimT family pseudopilin n=1 Tax=Rubrivivax sp. A210 TaxID=2772301 RepID=UPI001919DE81|nr:GspH/FimT family pseudopilin [Rubrivivax sp. A210]CAD5372080.1 Prepilin-type N-terminal cleavage/methylation domain-containing protein [Rubrivivax sp. A210]
MRTATTARPLHHQAGVTLVESLIGLAIAAVLAGTTAPGFVSALERRQLEGAAAQLETDIQLARSEAVMANRGLRVSFESEATGSCYVVHSGDAGDCRCSGNEQPVCSGTARAWRSASFASGSPVQLRSNVRSMFVDADKGTVSPTATLQLQGRSGLALNVVVNIMGRARQCTPTPPLAGLRAC